MLELTKGVAVTTHLKSAFNLSIIEPFTSAISWNSSITIRVNLNLIKTPDLKFSNVAITIILIVY